MLQYLPSVVMATEHQSQIGHRQECVAQETRAHVGPAVRVGHIVGWLVENLFEGDEMRDAHENADLVGNAPGIFPQFGGQFLRDYLVRRVPVHVDGVVPDQVLAVAIGRPDEGLGCVVLRGELLPGNVVSPVYWEQLGGEVFARRKHGRDSEVRHGRRELSEAVVAPADRAGEANVGDGDGIVGQVVEPVVLGDALQRRLVTAGGRRAIDVTPKIVVPRYEELGAGESGEQFEETMVARIGAGGDVSGEHNDVGARVTHPIGERNSPLVSEPWVVDVCRCAYLHGERADPVAPRKRRGSGGRLRRCAVRFLGSVCLSRANLSATGSVP